MKRMKEGCTNNRTGQGTEVSLSSFAERKTPGQETAWKNVSFQWKTYSECHRQHSCPIRKATATLQRLTHYSICLLNQDFPHLIFSQVSRQREKKAVCMSVSCLWFMFICKQSCYWESVSMSLSH